MCGIAGVFQLNLPQARIPEVLARMSAAMIHRGPDEGGCCTVPELSAGLAVRRLSIVDLETGSQPLGNEDGSVALVLNGEIYNHKTLRRSLEERGHRFRSRSDCEVALHLYEDHGPECLSRLNGMFGLAVLDRRRRRLLLARDRAGMKPLYWTRTAKGFLFASEAKALFASTLVTPAPDWEGLNICLAAQYIPAPRTCFRGVQRLAAGEYLLLEETRETRGSFWTMRYDNSRAPRSEQEYAEELERRLREAVATHLAADVPVGVFVSGGWDSSLAAVFASQLSPRPLKTFSIVFPEEPKESEGQYARILAERIGSEHHEVEFRTAQVPALLSEVVGAVEEPCTASPAPLLYQLSAAASREVKSVMGGEGSDELFAGYTWFRRNWLYLARRFAPRPLLRPIAERVRLRSLGKLCRILAAESDRSADLEWLRGFTPFQKRWFLHPDLPLVEGPDIAPLRPPPATLESCRDRLQERLSLDFTRRLADGMLLIEDKVSMAHSLEVRLPYLDRGIVDFALCLPSSMKLRDGREKYILSLLTRHLPPEIAKRRKYGLHFPMHAPPSAAFRAYLRDTLLGVRRTPELFQRSRLESWLEDVLARRRAPMRHAWIMTNLAVWWDRFLS